MHRALSDAGQRLWILVVAGLLLSPAALFGSPVVWSVNGHGYEVIATTTPICWTAARDDASDRGGYLVTLTSAAEQAFVESRIAAANPPTGSVWIGLTRSNGVFSSWITGESFGYTNWAPGEPNNVGGIEEQGSIIWTQNLANNGRSGTWNDMQECSPYEGYDYGPARSYVVEYTCVPPAVVDQPASRTTCPSDAAAFSVTVDGTGPFTYQWRKNGASMSDQANHILGATTETLVLINTTSADMANYDCVVSNSCGTVTSNAAALSCAPVLNGADSQPESQSVCCNNPAVFSVHPGCCADTATYVWSVKIGSGSWTNLSNGNDGCGNIVSGATTQRVTITPGTSNWPGCGAYLDGNHFRCTVSNACGSVVSNDAILTIPCPADFNCDGLVDFFDYLDFVNAFALGC